MKVNSGDMSYNAVTNDKFNYLKYTDNSDSQTLLFFLSPDSICMSIRIICDAGVKARKVNEFNTSYQKSGDNRWIDRRNGKDFLIEVREEQWTSVITIEPIK